MDSNQSNRKDSFGARLINFIKYLPHFFTTDIWRIPIAEASRTRRIIRRVLMSIVLAVRGFSEDRLMVKASALTYYTLFAIVPVIALVMAIARGFGMQDLIVATLSRQAGEHASVMANVLEFVNRYLEHARGGVFVGIGVVMLIWSVMSGFRHVETIFNDIWNVKKNRSISSQLSTYLSLMFVLPVLVVASSGLSMFLVSALSDNIFGVLSPFLIHVIKLLPYFINILIFTALFLIVPNTRVKFLSALTAGAFTGIVFQLFQFFYIKGQVFLTSYNAVYGGFAMVPLLLLWLQISWLIILLGAELSFAVQNYANYEYAEDIKKMSRRYSNFLLLAIMTLIVKRFVAEEGPYTSEDLSKETKIPIKIVRNSINTLVDVGLVVGVHNDDSRQKSYYPAVDVNNITIGKLISRIDNYGSDSLKLEENEKLAPFWHRLEALRKDPESRKVLLKDI